MPGYPLFLAGVYSAFGCLVCAVQIVQCLLGAGTWTAIFLLAWDWFDTSLALFADWARPFIMIYFHPAPAFLLKQVPPFC